MNPIIYPLFSAPIYYMPKTGVKVARAELGELTELTTILPTSGLTVDVNVLARPGLADARRVCEYHLNQYVRNVFGVTDNIYITTSWLSLNRPGMDHYAHSHPNSIISGCLYLRSGPTNRLNFHGQNHFNKMMPMTWAKDTFNVYNSDDWWVPVDTGTIVIWPSNLQHSAGPNQLDDVRIALCFNTFVKGRLGGQGDYAGQLVIN